MKFNSVLFFTLSALIGSSAVSLACDLHSENSNHAKKKAAKIAAAELKKEDLQDLNPSDVIDMPQGAAPTSPLDNDKNE